tara:strand:+ start:46 stop:228 length:183 start_codon:yes stop_codon:yes gene_type:complete
MDDETTALWDHLIETGLATEDELCLVTSINGTNLESLESVLYCRTGYRSLEQLQDMEGEG